MVAIDQAIDWASPHPESPVAIFSDSRSSLQALQSLTQRNKLIQNIQLKLINNKHIMLIWVRGHSGVLGNEIADGLAKEATRCPDVDLSLVKLPISHVKSLLTSEALFSWQQDWDNELTGRFTYNLLHKVLLPSAVVSPAQTAFLTNHGPFLSYLYRFHKLPTDICSCGSQGDSTHFATSCALTKHWHLKQLTNTNKHLWAKHILTNKHTIKKLTQLYIWLMNNTDNIYDTS